MPTKEEILASLSASKILANTKSWAEHGMTDAMRNKLPNMTWPDAYKLNKKQGYNKLYQGADKTSRLGYIKEGIGSLFGKYKPGSNIGGGTAITQKVFQNPTIKAITNHPLASKVATGLNRLGTAGLVYTGSKLGINALDNAGVYDKMDSAMDSAEDIFRTEWLDPYKKAGNSLMNMSIPAMTGIKNFAGFPGTHETKQQKEWMKNKLLEQVRNSGSLSGGLDYTDYGSKTASVPSGDWTGGFGGPEFAYGTTLGGARYTIPQQGGKVDWRKSDTAYDFKKGHIPDFIANIVNKGGLRGTGTPQHYTPNTTITAKDIYNLFGSGQLMHKGEPTITPPITQPINEPTITPPPATPATVPTYNPPQGPAGYTRPTRSPAQQAATVDRKAKSMGVASPIRYNSGTKYGFGL